MALTECANGHLYDTDQYATCPYCTGGMNRVEFSPGAAPGVGKTVGAPGAVPDPGLGKTVGAQPAPDTGKTVAVFQKSFDREPVTGWLVCIEGPEKGKDYRIAARNNSIGRSETMDICIKSDQAISREGHARLAYDGKYNHFYLIPGESANNIYVNGEPVYVPTQLKKGDILELGESKFLFIPFCDETFNWQDGLKQDG